MEFQRVFGVDRIYLLLHKLDCISRDDTLRAGNTCGRPFSQNTIKNFTQSFLFQRPGECLKYIEIHLGGHITT